MKKIFTILAFTVLFATAQAQEANQNVGGKTIFDFDIGYSYQMAESQTEKGSTLREYENKLRSGFTYGSSLLLRLNHVGSLYLGPAINMRHYSAKVNTTLDISDFVTMMYIAPKFTYTLKTKSNKGAWRLNYSVGYSHVWDQVKFGIGNKETATAGSICQAVEIVYDIRTGSRNWLSLKMGVTLGSTNKTKMDGKVISEEKQSMNSLNFTIGFRVGK